MKKLDLSNFIKKYSVYRKLMYIFVIALLIISRVSKVHTNTKITVVYCAFLGVFMLVEHILSLFDNELARRILIISQWVRLFGFVAIEYFLPKTVFLVAATGLLTILFVIECIITNLYYESYETNLKKLYTFLPTGLLLCFLYGPLTEFVWLYYLFYKIVSYLIAYYLIDFYVQQEQIYREKNNKLMAENSNYESVNAKLMEYREKVEAVNEQINYQKIDLNRAYKELEETNVEIESQTELMKYMASTFEVQKCLTVITETIIEVKKPKVCAVYINKDVYMNKVPTCVVKTSYTTMTKRLKKEADKIFEEFSADKHYPNLFVGEQVRKFKFVGDTNIVAVAVLPLIKDKVKYGFMIVGSDKENFFEKGFAYYENCIMQFNISIKSTLLYLQMRSMARRDGLTGIYNRIYFGELFEKAKASAKKYDYKLSVALFDIDKFKNVNDTYGHLAGDMVIKMVASIDEKYAEEYSGFACRYGGEEFLLVLPGKGKEEALEILEQMHEEIKNTVVDFEGTKININVCIGLSVYPDICEDANLLVGRADKAMYYGKQNGRGRLVVDGPEVDEFDETTE